MVSPKPARTQGVFGQCPQAQGVLLGCPEQGQELGFNDPGEFLPAHYILWFYDSMILWKHWILFLTTDNPSIRTGNSVKPWSEVVALGRWHILFTFFFWCANVASKLLLQFCLNRWFKQIFQEKCNERIPGHFQQRLSDLQGADPGCGSNRL